MTREEYIMKLSELDKERKRLKQAYIDSMPIKPKQIVIIDGKEYWLDSYNVVTYTIRPTLFQLSNGKPKKYSGVVYIDNWQNMKPKAE